MFLKILTLTNQSTLLVEVENCNRYEIDEFGNLDLIHEDNYIYGTIAGGRWIHVTRWTYEDEEIPESFKINDEVEEKPSEENSVDVTTYADAEPQKIPENDLLGYAKGRGDVASQIRAMDEDRTFEVR